MKNPATNPRPTEEQYGAFSALFDHFSRELFADALPQPMLVFSRRKMMHGHFILGGWEGEGGEGVDEIALNPDRFPDTAPMDLASTLVHEMCHQFQYRFGRPGRPGYHNAEFATIMAERGLEVRGVGRDRGRRTGQQMDHSIVADGPFTRAYGKLGKEVFFPFRCRTSDRPRQARRPDPSKTAYVSPSGKRRVWGAPGLVLVDGLTGERLESVGDEATATEVETAKCVLLRAVGGFSEAECREALAVLEAAGIGSVRS